MGTIPLAEIEYKGQKCNNPDLAENAEIPDFVLTTEVAIRPKSCKIYFQHILFLRRIQRQRLLLGA